MMYAADTVPSSTPPLHHLLTQPSSASDTSAAAAICGLKPPLHIAIDIDGFTSAARPAIFAHKYHPLTTTLHTKNSILAVKL
jgi:predicted O-linked N-acetylglucosamine transferase (SPINDLY family)